MISRVIPGSNWRQGITAQPPRWGVRGEGGGHGHEAQQGRAGDGRLHGGHGRGPCPGSGQYDVNSEYFGVEEANAGSCTGGTAGILKSAWCCVPTVRSAGLMFSITL